MENMNLNYKLVVFDMDGTILDTLEDLADSTNHALEKFGYPRRSIDEVRRFVGNGIRKLIERAVPCETPVEEVDKVFNEFASYYPVHCAVKTKPYADIKEILLRLKNSGCHIAVLSNKADNAVKILSEKYFGDLFEEAVGAKENVRKKPAPDALYNIMKHFNVDKNETVYVGDSDVDIETAYNAKVDGIIVDWGFRDRGFLENTASRYNNKTYIVSSPEELFNRIFTRFC